jgi:hypothetical protein
MARFKLRLMANKFVPGDITLPSDLNEVQSVLVCLPPQQRELTMVKHLLPDVTNAFAQAQIYLLASPGSRIYDIFPRKGYYILTPTAKHLTISGLPRSSYIQLLNEHKYDLILDMNLGINYFAQAILLSYPKAIRVGKANHLGQPFFNLEIKTRYLRDEKNIYKSMIETVHRLIDYGHPKIN